MLATTGAWLPWLAGALLLQALPSAVLAAALLYQFRRRVQAERHLRKLRPQAQNFVWLCQALRTPMVFADACERVQYVNDAFVRTPGFDGERAAGRALALVLGLAAPAGARQKMFDAATDSARQVKRVTRTRAGLQYQLEFDLYVQRDAAGAVTGYRLLFLSVQALPVLDRVLRDLQHPRPQTAAAALVNTRQKAGDSAYMLRCLLEQLRRDDYDALGTLARLEQEFAVSLGHALDPLHESMVELNFSRAAEACEKLLRSLGSSGHSRDVGPFIYKEAG